MSLPTATSGDDLWSELRSVIAQHIEPGHDAIDTINRLLRKSPWLKESGSWLQIPKAGLRLTEETRTIDQLWPLVHSTQVTEAEPTVPCGAVILLRWGGREYLMDGRRRINRWKREQLNGPHRALVIEKECP